MLSWKILSDIISLRYHQQVRPNSHETDVKIVMVVAKDNSWYYDLAGREQTKNILTKNSAPIEVER